MAEVKKTTTKKATTTKPVAKKTKTKTAPKKAATTKAAPKKTTTKAAPKKVVSKNLSNADQSFKLTKDAMFSVWIDALILVFIVLMFVLILYGYVMSA